MPEMILWSKFSRRRELHGDEMRRTNLAIHENEDKSKEEELVEIATEAREKVYNSDCHFFDPNNPSNLLKLLGIDWWKDIKPKLYDNECLPTYEVQMLLDRIGAIDITKELIESWFEEHKDSFKEAPNFDEALKHFTTRHKNIQEILKASIDNREELMVYI